MLATAALFAIFASYGSLKGVEPGVSLLVVLMSLKVLEAHTAREFQVMVLMGWVLCLCGFFLSQDFAIALCLSDRVRVAARGVDPVSSRIVTRRVLAAFGYDMQTPCPSGAARRPLVRFVSPNQCWLTVDFRTIGFGKLRLFRSTLPGQHRSACKFFGNCISRGVSRQ